MRCLAAERGSGMVSNRVHGGPSHAPGRRIVGPVRALPSEWVEPRPSEKHNAKNARCSAIRGCRGCLSIDHLRSSTPDCGTWTSCLRPAIHPEAPSRRSGIILCRSFQRRQGTCVAIGVGTSDAPRTPRQPVHEATVGTAIGCRGASARAAPHGLPVIPLEAQQFIDAVGAGKLNGSSTTLARRCMVTAV